MGGMPPAKNRFPVSSNNKVANSYGRHPQIPQTAEFGNFNTMQVWVALPTEVFLQSAIKGQHKGLYNTSLGLARPNVDARLPLSVDHRYGTLKSIKEPGFLVVQELRQRQLPTPSTWFFRLASAGAERKRKAPSPTNTERRSSSGSAAAAEINSAGKG